MVLTEHFPPVMGENFKIMDFRQYFGMFHCDHTHRKGKMWSVCSDI